MKSPELMSLKLKLEEWEVWRERLKEKLIELLGGFPEKSSIGARNSGKKEFEDYTREKIIFNECT